MLQNCLIQKKEEGNQVVAVVSAMGKTTDELLDLANAVNTIPTKREMDMLLSTGEQVSMALLAMAIQALGHEAMSFTGWQAGIVTDDEFSSAKIEIVQADRIREELERGAIVVVAGFQGLTHDGDITTLGRGGSDTTAVALASGLDADVCEIYSDVDGIYTADPRVPLKRASSMWFPTMICSSFRAKVQESCSHALLNSRVNTRWSSFPFGI